MKYPERFVHFTVRVSKGQAKLLDDCSNLTKQSRTDLVREALASYLPKLYLGLTKEKVK